MARKTRPLKLMDQRLLQAVSILSFLGGALFFLDRLALIGGYLVLASIVFMAASYRFNRRYQRVLEHPPAGYEFTGERVPNPPDGVYVEVWHRGISRVYVAADSARD